MMILESVILRSLFRLIALRLYFRQENTVCPYRLHTIFISSKHFIKQKISSRRASDERPYFKHKKSARQFNLRTVLPTYIFTYLHFFKK